MTRSRIDAAATHAIGDRWLGESRTALLRVPSVLAPESFNYLLNPSHARARVGAFSYPLDPHLARER